MSASITYVVYSGFSNNALRAPRGSRKHGGGTQSDLAQGRQGSCEAALIAHNPGHLVTVSPAA